MRYQYFLIQLILKHFQGLCIESKGVKNGGWYKIVPVLVLGQTLGEKVIETGMKEDNWKGDKYRGEQV